MMKLRAVAIVMALACLARAAVATDAELLVRQLVETAGSHDATVIAKQPYARMGVLNAGAAAIPYLLPLLKSNESAVRILAAWTLSDIDGLTEQHLDVLIQAYRDGTDITAMAIARIKSPRAAAFLIEQLIHQRGTEGMDLAIQRLGENAVPYLLQVYSPDRAWDEQLEERISSAFHSLGSEGRSAFAPLLLLARDKAASPERRLRAIRALGAIGYATDEEQSELQELETDPNEMIREAAEEALIGVNAVRVSDRQLRLRDLAALGARDEASRLEVLKSLHDESWEVRIAAVVAAGILGLEEARPDLMQMLKTTDDWRLVAASAQALSQLKAKDALSELEEVSKSHWYPPVRKKAESAIEQINDKIFATRTDAGAAFDFFSYENDGDEMESIAADAATQVRFPHAAQRPSIRVTFMAKDGSFTTEEGTGVAVEDGSLTGSDHGEWGGDISLVNREGKRRLLAYANTEAIYKTADAIIAVTGLAHMEVNEGSLFQITKSGDGKWRAKRWRALPGAPRFSRLLSDGKIFVSCHGGMVVVSTDGEMSSVTHSEVLKKISAPD